MAFPKQRGVVFLGTFVNEWGFSIAVLERSSAQLHSVQCVRLSSMNLQFCIFNFKFCVLAALLRFCTSVAHKQLTRIAFASSHVVNATNSFFRAALSAIFSFESCFMFL